MPHCDLIVIFRHFQVKKFGGSFSCRRNYLLWSLRKHVKIHVTFTEGKNVPEKFWLFQHQLKNTVSFEKYAFLVSNYLLNFFSHVQIFYLEINVITSMKLT